MEMMRYGVLLVAITVIAGVFLHPGTPQSQARATEDEPFDVKLTKPEHEGELCGKTLAWGKTEETAIAKWRHGKPQATSNKGLDGLFPMQFLASPRLRGRVVLAKICPIPEEPERCWSQDTTPVDSKGHFTMNAYFRITNYGPHRVVLTLGETGAGCDFWMREALDDPLQGCRSFLAAANAQYYGIFRWCNTVVVFISSEFFKDRFSGGSPYFYTGAFRSWDRIPMRRHCDYFVGSYSQKLRLQYFVGGFTNQPSKEEGEYFPDYSELEGGLENVIDNKVGGANLKLPIVDIPCHQSGE